VGSRAGLTEVCKYGRLEAAVLSGKYMILRPWLLFISFFKKSWSLDSAVGIATCYGLDDRGVGVRFPVGTVFFPLHVVQTGFGTHPASYPVGTVGSFPGGEAVGA
jgi:hypothetical protein